MRILGIDPGVAIVGFGLIESDRGSLRMLQYGAITTPAGQPLARLLQISRDMEELIQSFQPDEMSIEELFFPKISPRASPWPMPEGSSFVRQRSTSCPSMSIRPCR